MSLKQYPAYIQLSVSRARRVVENVFGILSSRFAVFQKPIHLSPEKASSVTLACCYLHNFLIRETGHVYCSKRVMTHENEETGEVVQGSHVRADCLPELQRTQSYTSRDGNDIRDKFCKYFCNEGQVTWQNRFVN